MVELKESLKKIKKRDDELNFRAQKTEEFLNMFVSMKSSEAKALFKQVEGLEVPRLKPEHIIKMIDIVPISQEEVSSVLQAYPIIVTKENMKKIADIFVAFVEEKDSKKK